MSDNYSRIDELRHTLNNNLNNISMTAELARLHAQSGDADALESALASIIADCRRAADLIHSNLSD